jgi:predicted lipid-binding transport protein (Tim44 family)
MAVKKKEPKTWTSANGNIYTEENVQNIRKVADLLSEAFIWEDTKEDTEFWSDKVFDRLHEIANDIEKRLGTDGSKL